MDELKKDPLVRAYSTKIGVENNKKTGEPYNRLQLYIEPEFQATLIAALQASTRRVKLDIHTVKRTNGTTGHEFDSSFFFVKDVDPEAGSGGKPTFKPKGADTAGTASTINAMADELKKKSVG